MPAAQIPEVVSCGSFNFQCTAEGCNYSKRDVYGIVLHMRTHFIYETAESDMGEATFVFQNGYYQCLDCKRNTNCKLSFKEHVRHHILKHPYMCRHCMKSVGSIFELRKHSSSDHPKTPLQLCFAETNGQLKSIMSLLGPVHQTFTFRTDCGQVVNSSSRRINGDDDHICDDISVDQISPVSFQKTSSVSHSRIEPNFRKLLLSKNSSIPVIKKTVPKSRKRSMIKLSSLSTDCSCIDSAEKCECTGTSKASSVRMGKFIFSDEKFQCLTCKFKSTSEDDFQRHVGMHLHSEDSKICRNNCEDGLCPFVFGILTLLKNIHPSSALHSSNTANFRIQTERNLAQEVGTSRNVQNRQDLSPCVPSLSPPQEQSDFINTSKSAKMLDKANAFYAERSSPHTDATNNASVGEVRSCDQLSSELRFSEKCLESLRSKAGKLLDFNNFSDEGGVPERNDLNSSKSIYARNNANNERVRKELCIQNSESDTKMSFSDCSIKHNKDISNSGLLGYYEFARDSTPLSKLCEKCSYTCNCSVQLKYHVDTCHNTLLDKKNEFHCPECLFSGNSKQILIWHMAHHIGHHSLTIYVCSYCSHQSSSVSRINKHLLQCHSNQSSDYKTEVTKVDYMDGIFKCPICKAGFPWGNLFFRHVASQHSLQELADYLTTLYDEKVCPEVIRVPKCLLPNIPEHQLSASTNAAENKAKEVYYCSDCDVCFKTSNDFISHCSKHKKDQRGKNGSSENLAECTYEHHHRNVDKLNEIKEVNSHNGDLTSKNKHLQLNKTNLNLTFRNVHKSNQICGSSNRRNLKPGLQQNCQTGVIYKSHKNWIKKYRAPMASNRACVQVMPSRVPTLPRNLETTSSSDFEKSLPDMFVFSEAIKCPKCYYSDRVRLNLIRHYNGHFKDSSKPEDPKDVASVNSVSESGLSFSLWEPECSSNENENSKDLPSAIDGQESGISDNEEASFNDLEINDKISTVPLKKMRTEASFRNAGNTGNRSMEGVTAANAMPIFGQFLENHAKKTLTRISCESCSVTFTNDSDRDKHARDVHSSAYYVCRCCGIMIHGLLFVYKHYEERHPGSQVLVDPWVSSKKESKIRKIPDVSEPNTPNDNSQIDNNAKRKDKSDVPPSASSGHLSSSPDFNNVSEKKYTKEEFVIGSKLKNFDSDSPLTVHVNGSEEVNSSALFATDSNESISSQQFGRNISGVTSANPYSQIMPNPISTSSNLENNLLTLLANLLTASIASNETVPAVQMPVPARPQVSTLQDPVALLQNLFNRPQCLAARASTTDSSTSQMPSSLAEIAAQITAAFGLLPSGTSGLDFTQVAPLFNNWLMASLTAFNVSNIWQNFGSGNDAADLSSFLLKTNAMNALLASGGASNISSLNEFANKVDASCHANDVQNSLANKQDNTKTRHFCGGDDDSKQSFRSADTTNKVLSSDSNTKLSDSEHLYSSDPESLVSFKSHCSNNSKSSRSTATSKSHLEKRRNKKGYKFYSSSSETDSEIFSAECNHLVSAENIKKDRLALNIDPDAMGQASISYIRFCCHCCRYSTKELDHFRDHLSVHLLKECPVDPKLWKPLRQRCGFCSFQTYLEDEFEEHVLTHTISKPFQCHYCSFSSFAKSSILRHLTRFHCGLEPKFEKNQNILKKRRSKPYASSVCLSPVVKVQNVLTLSRVAIKCLQYDHGLKKINLNF